MAEEPIRIKIQGYDERVSVLSALAHNGYMCYVEEKDNNYPTKTEYYVCFYQKAEK